MNNKELIELMERMTEDLNEAYKRGYEDGIKIRKEVRQEVMTLDEAIKHCEEVAEEKDMQAGFETDYSCYQMFDTERNKCKECANEHRQLAEWLKELKEYRKESE